MLFHLMSDASIRDKVHHTDDFGNRRCGSANHQPCHTDTVVDRGHHAKMEASMIPFSLYQLMIMQYPTSLKASSTNDVLDDVDQQADPTEGRNPHQRLHV